MYALRGSCPVETGLMLDRVWRLAGFIVLMALPLFGLGDRLLAGTPDEPEEQFVRADPETVLGPGDELNIEVSGSPDLSRTVIVNANGDIFLPLIGKVKAVNETSLTLTDSVRTRLMKRFVRDPVVTVTLVVAAERTVWVGGYVRSPGAVEVSSDTSLLSVLDSADIRDLKSVDTPILLLRSVAGKRLIARFSLSELRAGTNQPPQILVGDVIHVGPDKLTLRDLKLLTPQTGTFYQLAPFPTDVAAHSGK